MEFIQIVGDDVGRILQEAGEEIITVNDENSDAGTNGEAYDMWDRLFNPLNNQTQNSNQLSPASDIEVSAVLTALKVNIVLFVGVLLVYEVLSRTIPSVYKCNKQNEASIHLPTYPLPLNWVPAILRVSWSQVRKLCGMDAYFFLRYIRMVFQITFVSGLWGILILWPVYASGGNDAHGWYHLSMANLENGSWKLWIPIKFIWLLTFYVVFMVNEEYRHYVECRMEFLANGDSRIHPQQRYTLLVEQIPKELRSDRALKEYFDQLFPGKVHSACLVLNVPDLQDVFQRRQRVLNRLEKAQLVERLTARRPFHKVWYPTKFDFNSSCPPHKRPGTFAEDRRLPQPGERVDSIGYFTMYLEVLNEEVAKLQHEKLSKAQSPAHTPQTPSEWISQNLGISRTQRSNLVFDGSSAAAEKEEAVGDGLLIASGPPGVDFSFLGLVQRLGTDFFVGGFVTMNRQLDAVVDTVVGRVLTSTGFVTFTDLATLTCAVRAPLSHVGGSLEVQIAPEPRDIEWDNAHINKSWKDGRIWTANMLLGAGAILWSIPVTAVQALANLEKLAEIPGMSWIKGAATGEMTAFLNGYLPVLALIALIAVLPQIFQWVALNYEHRKAQSDVHHSVLCRFFYYQLANVYITISAGSVLDPLAEILDHPSKAFELLGKSVPTVVGYFVMFLLTKLFAGLPVILLRVGSLTQRILTKALCREGIMTEQERRTSQAPGQLELGREYPNQLLVIVIVFTYASISPVILPVGALYFIAALIVYKKQILLVYESTVESGGVFFPTVCQRTLVGLMAGQVTLIGYMVLRAGFYQPIVLLPLPFYTWTMIGNFKRMYEDPGSHLSLENAVQLDRGASPVGEFSETTYRQPNLIVKDIAPSAPTSATENPAGTAEASTLETEKAV